MSYNVVGRGAVIASVLVLAACGPSAEQIGFETRVGELEGELEATSAELAAVNSQKSELVANVAELEQRLASLTQENETLHADTAGGQSAAESMRVAKDRLGIRLSTVQAELWALEQELALERALRSRMGALYAEKTIAHDRLGADLALEKHLRSRLGAAHARAVLDGHQSHRALAQERHMRGRLGAAHARAVHNGHQTDRALAQEKNLRSRLGAMHANLKREHWGLDDRHQTVLILRSKLGAGLAAAHEDTRDLELALRKAEASAFELAATNENLQASLDMATNANDRRWQNFATQLKSLANSLESEP